MKKEMTMWLRILMAIAIIGTVGGCATSRSVVSLDQPAAAAINPEHGVAVKIVRVSDARTFEASPKNPDTPSLGGQDVNDRALTARAIARKRNGLGRALGDVLLPENQTVADLMKTTMVDSFRKAHYRVLVPGDVGYDAAIPIQAQVVQFWSWLQPGFWELKVHNRAEVRITGSLPALNNGLTVHGSVDESMTAVGEDDWQEIASKGLKDFSDNLIKALAKHPSTE
jgi:hypothetical protein